MKKLFSAAYFWPCFAALLAVCMVNTPFAIHPQLADKGPSWLGLDVSWTMTLNYAFAKHLIWGKDILYTYGPLAFFSTRVGPGISKWLFLLFDSFIIVNFYFVFSDFLKNQANRFLAVSILICMMLVVNPFFGSDLSWVVFFFIIYWMKKTFDEPRPIFLVILIVLTVLAFYIKMNTGLISIVLLAAHFVNLLIHKKITWLKLLFSFLFFAVVVVVSALMLHVSIFNYISGSLEIIKGYNDVMYLDEGHHHIEYNLYLLFFAMLLWFVYQLWRQLREKKYGDMLYPIAGIIFIFLLQKQSILRDDVQHLYEYFSIAPLILLSGFGGIAYKKPQLKYALIMILFALFFVAETRTIDVSAANRITGPKDYLKQFNEYNSIAYFDHPGKRYIPQPVLGQIGKKTVDVFPWDGEYALENKLNYMPRPVFQSFSVYTAALEKLNYDYYVKHAPEFLIYDYDAIDNRYPFNDESLVNLFILNNYTLIDTFISNERPRLVLQRNNTTIPLKFTPVKKEAFFIKDAINTNGFNFIKLNIGYSLTGRLKALLHRPPHLQISYMREDGKWFAYKTSVELLRSGLYVGSMITNDAEYADLITGKHTAVVKKVSLQYDNRYFKEDGVLETYMVK